MKNLIVMAIAFASSVVASAEAATVTYRLYTDPYGQGPNTFKLTAEVTGADAFGLAAYGVQLVGNPTVGNGGSILTVNHGALRGFDIETISPGGDPGVAGITLLRSGDDNNAAVGSAAISITGSQDTSDPTAHLIRGFGMEASDAASKNLTGVFPEGNPWGNAGVSYPGRPSPPPGEFEIARGTLAVVPGGGSAIDFHPFPTSITGANVFISANGIGVKPATIVCIRIPNVPEPATVGMASIALLSLATLRRRK